MKTTRNHLILGSLAASLLLAACGGGGSTTDIPGIGDIGNIDTGAVQESGQASAAASAECSAGAGKMSEELQVLTQAIRDKDLEAAQATAPVFEEAAQQMGASATAGMEAAQKMPDLPVAGNIAEKGLETVFKVCQATSELATDLATKVSSADSDSAFAELETATKDFTDKINKASEEMTASMGG